MKIVVDDKIPFIREKLAVLADNVVYLKGADIHAEDGALSTTSFLYNGRQS